MWKKEKRQSAAEDEDVPQRLTLTADRAWIVAKAAEVYSIRIVIGVGYGVIVRSTIDQFPVRCYAIHYPSYWRLLLCVTGTHNPHLCIPRLH